MPATPLFILLADDDPEDLELFEEVILSVRPGTRISSLTTGKALISFLAGCNDNELPHLVILDYNMPQMKGTELLQELNAEKRYKNIPKFVLSTSDADYHIKECMDNGAKYYFVKPDNVRDIELIVKKMLDMLEDSTS